MPKVNTISYLWNNNFLWERNLEGYSTKHIFAVLHSFVFFNERIKSITFEKLTCGKYVELWWAGVMEVNVRVKRMSGVGRRKRRRRRPSGGGGRGGGVRRRKGEM